MLARLSIRDIVLIDQLDLEFPRGLTILTGETALKTLGPGDTVEAGALNADGELLVKVDTIWGQRHVDRIAQNVRQMFARKTAAQALAERATHYLVPAICLIAAAA